MVTWTVGEEYNNDENSVGELNSVGEEYKNGIP